MNGTYVLESLYPEYPHDREILTITNNSACIQNIDGGDTLECDKWHIVGVDKNIFITSGRSFTIENRETINLVEDYDSGWIFVKRNNQID